MGGYAAISNYNALGQPGHIGFQNGASTTFSYYPSNNRLQELSTTTPGAGTVQDFRYGYDYNGNLTSLSNQNDSSQNQILTYDGLNRLTSAQSVAYGTINYGLDEIGNIQTGSDSGKASDRTGQALTYDYDNRVSSITNGGATTSFVYNYSGSRVKKTTDVGASETIYLGNLYEIKNGVATKHIFAGGRRIASKTGSYVYYYHLDHLGSLSVATDGSGAPVQTLSYYPFGEVRTNTGSVDLPYKFTGKELDSETGLYNFGARYYDAAVGRFISADTIVQSPGNPQSLNRYAYCMNNPLNAIDPTGNFSIGSFFKSFFTGLVSAVVFVAAVILIAGTWGAASPFVGAMAALSASQVAAAGAIAGAVGGGMGAALNGGNILTGIVMGAAMGAASGGFVGSFAPGLQQAIAGIGLGMVGAGTAYAQGGLDGLAYFGAGLAGGMVGSYAMDAVAGVSGAGHDYDHYYSQKTGAISHLDTETGENTGVVPEGNGYSGNGPGLNNPAYQAKTNIGPIPQGDYTIDPLQYNHFSSTGKNVYSMYLDPEPSNTMFNRGGFYFHRGNFVTMGSSKGCIVVPNNVLDFIGNSPDRHLKVLP